MACGSRITNKAFELWQERGYRDGHDLEDWLDAEAIVMKKYMKLASEATAGLWVPYPFTDALLARLELSLEPALAVRRSHGVFLQPYLEGPLGTLLFRCRRKRVSTSYSMPISTRRTGN
jgi:hypothetical protein